MGGSVRTVYQIVSRDANGKDDGWQLMLTDAATVLDCFRRDDASVVDLVKFMVTTGRSFSTRCPQPIDDGGKTLNPGPRRYSLGHILPGEYIWPEDYFIYDRACNDFFAEPWARAALSKGGIVWRLALEHIRSLAVEKAIEGPTESAFVSGSRWDVKNNGELWDDDLGQDDLDFICGLYKVFEEEGE